MATGQSHLLMRNFCPYHLRLIGKTSSLLPSIPSFSSSSCCSLKQLNDHYQLRFTLSSCEKLTRASTFRATSFDDHGGTIKMADIDWDNLGFNPMPTDYMYVMRCAAGEQFLDGGLQPFGEIELNPFSSVLNYGQGQVQSMNLVVENETHRAVPGGFGSVKAIGNYASIMTAQAAAKAKGFDDVLYLDAVHNRYVEEVSTANIFVVKDKMISTPELIGTILPGITRQSVIDVAHSQGFKVEERPVAVEELFGAEEVFCTGNAIGLLPVGSITYMDKRVCYKGGGVGTVSHHLSSVLTSIQMGLTEDKMGWTVSLQ